MVRLMRIHTDWMFIFPSFSVFVARVGFCSSSIPSQNFFWTVALIARIIPNCIFFLPSAVFFLFCGCAVPKGGSRSIFVFCSFAWWFGCVWVCVGGVESFPGGAICDQEAYDSEGKRKKKHNKKKMRRRMPILDCLLLRSFLRFLSPPPFPPPKKQQQKYSLSCSDACENREQKYICSV